MEKNVNLHLIWKKKNCKQTVATLKQGCGKSKQAKPEQERDKDRALDTVSHVTWMTCDICVTTDCKLVVPLIAKLVPLMIVHGTS